MINVSLNPEKAVTVGKTEKRGIHGSFSLGCQARKRLLLLLERVATHAA